MIQRYIQMLYSSKPLQARVLAGVAAGLLSTASSTGCSLERKVRRLDP